MNKLLRELHRINWGIPKFPEYDPQDSVGPPQPTPGSPAWERQHGGLERSSPQEDSSVAKQIGNTLLESADPSNKQ